MISPQKIRNIAIIAHIDHGKTTLMDAVLKQSHIFRDNEQVDERALDSNDQEKERGITILAKHTSVPYNDYQINVIDTPGHADFSGEVERVLGMVGTVLLLVDAKEGPMPQTRFVLSKALKLGLKPIVVINKIDRPHADPDRALNLTFDLFTELGATDEQLDFRYIYASGIAGYAVNEVHEEPKDLTPLFELIIDACPAPAGDLEAPFLMQAMTLSYSDYLGREATGRILQGVIKKGDPLVRVEPDGTQSTGKAVRITGYLGLKTVELEQAGVGDIVRIAGFPEVKIGDALCGPQAPKALPALDLDEPTVSIDMLVNSSPFAGQDGKHVTMNKIKERLATEARANISLRIEEVPGNQDMMKVSGRGELHLAVLIEAMRREGFELTVSRPRVITKEENGQLLEPYENVHIEVPEEFSGAIIEEMAKRKAIMSGMSTNEHGLCCIEFSCPTRGLIGYRNEFLTQTKGLGVLTSIFDKFDAHKGNIPGRKNGVLIAMTPGKINAYACSAIQDRGILFVGPGDDTYEGMVIGENARDNDLVVNITKTKQLTNFRASGKDEAVSLKPPTKYTLEQAMEYINDDELIEVTPRFIRIRKRFLTENERKRNASK